jgi:hypothetical protein
LLRLFFLDLSAIGESNGVAGALLALAKDVGGRSYRAGAICSEQEAIIPGDRAGDIAEFRRTVDPDNRFNPRHVATSNETTPCS